MPELFTLPDAWSGGFYMLAIEFEPFDLRTEPAVTRLWQHPSLLGCYYERDKEPEEQPRLAPDPAHEGHLYGIATLPNGSRVPCGSLLWRFGANPDWLEFYIPTGSLATAYPIGAFPFEYQRNFAWQHEIDEWLASVARYVYEAFPFQVAVIGFEVDLPNLSAVRLQGEGVPEKRFESYLLPTAQGLQWYPVNAGPIIKLGK